MERATAKAVPARVFNVRLRIDVVFTPPTLPHARQPFSRDPAVTVAIRPEKIDFYTAGSSRNGSDPNLFDGKVTSVVYIGTDTQYGVQLAGGQQMRVRMQNDLPGSKPVAAEGEAVQIGFSVDAARILTE